MRVQTMIESYLSDPDTARLRSFEEVHRLLVRYTPAWLGAVAVRDVKLGQVRRAVRSMKSTPVQANRWLAALSSAFVWAIREELRADNPCEYVKRYPEQARDRYASSEERERILAVLDAWRPRYPESVSFVRLVMLTGARVSEVLAIDRRRVDDGVLALPRGKNGDRRILYFNQLAQEELRRMPDDTFSLTNPGRFWRKVREAAGVPDLRLHDLRHTFASAGLAAGLTLEQVGGLLGHRSASSTKRYMHLMTEQGVGYADRVGGVL